jgi:hypothetical protein
MLFKLQNLEIGTGRLGFSLASNIANTKIDGKNRDTGYFEC